MRNYWLVAMFISIAQTSSGQVTFENNSFENVITAAAKEGKLAMVDAYTDWCGWCKVMDEKTFSDPLVGEYINSRFVSTKINMEEGFGIDLAMKYRVTYFPQFLFFDGQGHLIGRIGGFLDAPSFTEAVKHLLDGNGMLPPLPEPMNFSLDYPEFYVNSFKKSKERKQATPEEIEAWLSTREDITDQVTWGVITRFVRGGDYATRVIQMRHELEAKYGRKEVLDNLSGYLFADVRTAIKENDSELLEATLLLADAILDDDAEAYKQRYKLYYYQMTEQWERYSDEGVKLASQNNIAKHAGELNEIAWTLYEKSDQRESLDKAAKWMALVVKHAPGYAYYDTYAALLYKTGKRDEAMRYAQMAIDIGTEGGQDVSETEALLENIKRM